MTDKIDEKIISIFARHKKQLPIDDEHKIIRNSDGFYYVCINKDENGKHFDKKKLLERANSCYYIVKVMLDGSDHPHICNFRIPGEKILNFLTPYINEEKEGEIIEIDKYFPDDLA
ncbi:MAG: hypothetical protein PHC34_11635 [Candidatus Gastranaerophilales bacterium]|nr:hypothetical protein [Candidatus Gastranaerophilales bacterium]